MRTHLDGARLMNAVVASGVPAADYASGFDTAWIDFTKGLGAPVGAALAGSSELIAEAWRWKQMMGGAMRQSGIVAAGCLYALDHHVERMADDHGNARRLAEGLATLPADRARPDQGADQHRGVRRPRRARAGRDGGRSRSSSTWSTRAPFAPSPTWTWTTPGSTERWQRSAPRFAEPEPRTLAAISGEMSMATNPQTPRRALGGRRAPRGRSVRSIITEVALTTAVADTPGASPSSSIESRVIAAVTRNGPASTSTSAITPSASTERTTPEKRLRAERSVPVRWRCGRAVRRRISEAGTIRRLRASRLVWIWPLRSQRRSVSTLTPSAEAASPSERSCVMVRNYTLRSNGDGV